MIQNDGQCPSTIRYGRLNIAAKIRSGRHSSITNDKVILAFMLYLS